MRNVSVVNLLNSLSIFQQPYVTLLFCALLPGKHRLVTKTIMVMIQRWQWYTPFPTCLKPLFQSDVKCKDIGLKMISYSYAKQLI